MAQLRPDPSGTAPLALLSLREGSDALPWVMLHGFPLDHRMWLEVAGMVGGDPTVLAPDLPGFGRSRVRPLPGEPSIDVMADAVAQTLHAHGVGRALVAGLSMGGYVAMALTERHPELVAGLALLDTRSTADAPAARSARLDTAEALVAEQSVDTVIRSRYGLLGATNRAKRPDLAQRIGSWIANQRPESVAWALRAMAARPDRTDVLRGYAGPALVIVGEEDELTPVAMSSAMAEALPDAELVVVPRAGHMPTVESPQVVATALTAYARALTQRPQGITAGV